MRAAPAKGAGDVRRELRRVDARDQVHQTVDEEQVDRQEAEQHRAPPGRLVRVRELVVDKALATVDLERFDVRDEHGAGRHLAIDRGRGRRFGVGNRDDEVGRGRRRGCRQHPSEQVCVVFATDPGEERAEGRDSASRPCMTAAAGGATNTISRVTGPSLTLCRVGGRPLDDSDIVAVRELVGPPGLHPDPFRRSRHDRALDGPPRHPRCCGSVGRIRVTVIVVAVASIGWSSTSSRVAPSTLATRNRRDVAPAGAGERVVEPNDLARPELRHLDPAGAGDVRQGRHGQARHADGVIRERAGGRATRSGASCPRPERPVQPDRQAQLPNDVDLEGAADRGRQDDRAAEADVRVPTGEGGIDQRHRRPGEGRRGRGRRYGGWQGQRGAGRERRRADADEMDDQPARVGGGVEQLLAGLD